MVIAIIGMLIFIYGVCLFVRFAVIIMKLIWVNTFANEKYLDKEYFKILKKTKDYKNFEDDVNQMF